MTYRKRPVVIEAVQFNGENVHEVLDVTGSGSEWWWTWYGALRIRALMFLVVPGDWIVRGITGEFYPVKSDVFALTYEEVSE